MFRVTVLIVCVLVSAHALHVGHMLDPGDGNTTVTPSPDPSESGRLGFVKLGVAVAMFVSVLIACGLPIVILDCIQKRTDDAACSLTTLSRGGQGVSSSSDSSSTPLDTTGSLRDPTMMAGGSVGNGSARKSHRVESTHLLTENGEPYESSLPSSPEGHPFSGQWSTSGNSGPLIQPICESKTLRRRRIYRRRRAIQLWTSRITCFAAGVFLSTGFMDLFPDVEEAVTAALSSLEVHLEYPLSSFFTLVGFFTVLLIEQTVIVCRHSRSPNPPRPDLPHDSFISASAASQAESSGVPVVGAGPTGDLSTPELSDTPQVTFGGSVEEGLQQQAPQLDSSHQAEHHHHHHHHLPIDNNSGSIMRVFLLLISLCVHSVFEGLAVGLQRSVSEVVALFSALMLHKLIMAVSIGMSLATSRQRSERTGAAPNRRTLLWQMVCTGVFALASPLGVLIGYLLIAQRSSGALLMTIAVLQGLACGTFFFVVFCEMLPNEFKEGSRDRIMKFIFLILGFALVAVYLVFHPE